MNKISIYLCLGLMVLSLVAGVAAGYSLTPQYMATAYDKDMDLGIADRLVDLRYINAMAAHHKGTILLADQAAKESSRQEIKDLAAKIESGEPILIDELYGWKKDWYRDGRKAQDPVVARLGAADDKFDLRFLNALIAHHESGVMIVKEVRSKSSRAEVLNNADAVEKVFTDGISMLKGWRNEWYNI